jgi:hypothetical protein
VQRIDDPGRGENPLSIRYASTACCLRKSATILKWLCIAVNAYVRIRSTRILDCSLHFGQKWRILFSSSSLMRLPNNND